MNLICNLAELLIEPVLITAFGLEYGHSNSLSDKYCYYTKDVQNYISAPSVL